MSGTPRGKVKQIKQRSVRDKIKQIEGSDSIGGAPWLREPVVPPPGNASVEATLKAIDDLREVGGLDDAFEAGGREVGGLLADLEILQYEKESRVYRRNKEGSITYLGALTQPVSADEEIKKPDPVNHPKHYTFGKIEVIDVIEDWQLGFALGNAVKYIARAEHKGRRLEDLRKAAWYLAREIDRVAREIERVNKTETRSSG